MSKSLFVDSKKRSFLVAFYIDTEKFWKLLLARFESFHSTIQQKAKNLSYYRVKEIRYIKILLNLVS